jgi:hypothetical protein
MACAALAGFTTGCSGPVVPTPPASRQPPIQSKRAATKVTCPQAVVSRPPRGMHLSDRELVAVSSTELGTRSLITEAGKSGNRQLEVISGGYVDDLTEDYDDLRVVRQTTIAGESGTVLAGSLLSTSVELVVWREQGVAAPCDVHAVVASNMGSSDFRSLLTPVRVERSTAPLQTR